MNPGDVCPSCERRIPHPRQGSTPDTAVLGVRGPKDRKEALHEGLKALSEFTGATKAKYPLCSLLEMLLVLGSQNREELKDWFEERGDYESH